MNMQAYIKNPHIGSNVFPVDIVFHPSWWHKNVGITFDKDFFYHPLKRVESEQRMEKELYDRFGRYELGLEHNEKLPEIGAVHNAAGYFLSELLGCKVEYLEGEAPQVISAGMEKVDINIDDLFSGPVMKRLQGLIDALKCKYGYVRGEVNWGGVF